MLTRAALRKIKLSLSLPGELNTILGLNSRLIKASELADYNKTSTVPYHSFVYESSSKCVAIRVLIFPELNKMLIELNAYNMQFAILFFLSGTSH